MTYVKNLQPVNKIINANVDLNWQKIKEKLSNNQ